jgi:nitrate reductase NapA
MTNLRTDRRAFLKASAMAAATAAMAAGVAGPGFPLPVLGETRTDEQGVRWDKAPCRFCGTGCQVQVGVKEGRVVAIAGDLLADVNKGLLCVKGYHVGKVLYGTDRLTRPLVRKGDGYEPIAWNDAIDLIARKIRAAPDRFAFYGSGQWTIGEGAAAN